MSDRVDHRAEARLALEHAMRDVSENWTARTGESKADIIAQAQVHATLALVEQQRIANRLMLAALVSDVELRVGQHGARVGLLGPEGIFRNPPHPDARCPLDDDIREGLTL